VKSSFLKNTVSKEVAIVQFLRPQVCGRMVQALEVFSRAVDEAETLVKLGIMLQPGGTAGREKFHVTPEDLKANLDEFSELEKLATEGKALLASLGYVPQRKATPLPGSAPVGETVDVKPIITQLPGEEPLAGVVVAPKAKR
jgi:hypothetical protein